jgi:hypothetical protein
MILLSIASKQIWPQLLAVAYLKPERLFLLHSDDAVELKGPAQRLKRFFDDCGLLPKGSTRLHLIPNTDFHAIEQSLDELQRSQQLPMAECMVNFTGGNKLMATAAFRWATQRGLTSFYLERGLQLTKFEPRDNDLVTKTLKINGHIADDLDPVALTRCQLDASEIERKGETITLNATGCDLSDWEFLKRIHDGIDPLPFLDIANPTAEPPKEGDHLELSTAAVLLKLGVRRVQRGLRLKVRSVQHVGTRLPHAEIDLLFTWGGRLWLVDCKDRKAPESLADGLKRELHALRLSANAAELLGRITKELMIGQTKAMKEDLLAVREVGGLLGSIICVRKTELGEEVLQFAKHNQINVVQKNNLVDGLRAVLNPHSPT